MNYPEVKNKRIARLMAMQLLYAIEISGDGIARALPMVLEGLNPDDVQKSYGLKLAEIVIAQQERIDSLLTPRLANWSFERLAILDKILLRLGVAEMQNCPEVPAVVVLSEMTNIAKKFSTENSASFVNGVLETFFKEIQPQTR